MTGRRNAALGGRGAFREDQLTKLSERAQKHGEELGLQQHRNDGLSDDEDADGCQEGAKEGEPGADEDEELLAKILKRQQESEDDPADLDRAIKERHLGREQESESSSESEEEIEEESTQGASFPCHLKYLCAFSLSNRYSLWGGSQAKQRTATTKMKPKAKGAPSAGRRR